MKERLVHLPGDREAIRFYASQIALDMVRMHFLYNGNHAQPRRGFKLAERDVLPMRLFVAIEIPSEIRNTLSPRF